MAAAAETTSSRWRPTPARCLSTTFRSSCRATWSTHGHATVRRIRSSCTMGSPGSVTSVRGVELARYVDMVLNETNAAKVVIIGHSQGGLDPRYMISTLGYGDRVAL